MESSLGKRIAEARKKLGLTQEELAEKLSVSPQAVSKWENDMSCPDVLLLPRLADLFDTTIDELLRGPKPAEVRLVPPSERRDLNRVLLKMVVDSQAGDRVRINLPMSLVKIGLELGLQSPSVSGVSALKDLDFNAIVMAVEQGVIGKLMEVESANGDHVEIWVE